MNVELLQHIQVTTAPESIQAFLALQKELARTAQGGATMMMLALVAYGTDESFGLQCLTVAVIEDDLMQGRQGYQGRQVDASRLQLVESQLSGKAYITHSYVQGATPDNKYKLPELPWVFEYTTNRHSGDPDKGPFKVFVTSSGADMPRPMTLKPNDHSLWKASEWSSILLGVRAPRTDKPGFT